MAWAGGFSGDLRTMSEAKSDIAKVGKVPWAKFVAIHNTGAPNIAQWNSTKGGSKQRIKNLENYYKNEKRWSGGPHAFIPPEGGVLWGTPLSFKGTHSPSWNGSAWGIEMAADFAKDDPTKGDGLRIVECAAHLTAMLLKNQGLPANNDTVKFHKEDKATTHDCPGKLLKKEEFLKKVQSYMTGDMGVDLPAPDKGPVPITYKDPWTTEGIQKHLTRLGYNVGAIDGIWGPKTEAALKSFQQAVNVLPTGKIGPWVWNKLATLEPRVSPPAAPVTPPPATDPGKPVGKDRPKAFFKYYVDHHKLPPYKAAAIVGRLQRESYPDLRPGVWGDFMLNGKPVPRTTPGAEGTAFGFAQWRGLRLDHLKKFATARNEHIEDDWTQLDFVLEEMKTTEKVAGNAMNMATNLTEAVKAMMHFERPKGYRPSCPECGDGFKETIAFAEKLL